jgi:hypothetical protein
MKLRSAVLSLAALEAILLIGSVQAAIQTLAVTNVATPEGNGKFLIFSLTNATAPVLNNAGQVAFWASLQNTSGGANDDTGIYLYDGTVLKNVVRENSVVPESGQAGGNFNVLVDLPSLNNTGQVAFDSSLRNTPFGSNDNVGTYLYNGSALVKLARRGDLLPDGNGQYSQSVGADTVNAAGHVRIKTSLQNTSSFLGIYLHNGSNLVKIARLGDAAPEGNGQFDDFSDFKQGFNDADQVAFQATLRNTSGGFNDNQGIYFYNGSTLVNLARANAPVPEGNGQFATFSASALVNAAGEVAFSATLRNTSGASLDNSGVYLYNGSAVVKIVREGATVPETDGQFDGFDFPVVNDAGELAFFANLRNTNSQTDSGIYLHNGTTLKKVVREGTSPPEGNGQFDTFSRLQLNATGQIAFRATLRNTSGGLNDDGAVYVTDGTETVKVAREGDTLAGAVMTFLDTTGGYSTDLGLRNSFNDFGQVAFRAAAANGSQGIFLFTPDLRWRSTTSGSWDTAANWTLSLKPGAPHNVSITPTTSLTVTGPASNVTLHSLTVGDNVGVAQPALNLKSGSILNASAAITLKNNANVGFEIGGTNAADFARLTTGGIATLDGGLAVQLINGFLPGAGDMFDILTATGGITGTFDTTPEQLPALSGGLKWQINYGAHDVVLAVVAAGLFGDYNGNGIVDAADYTVWRDHLGQSVTLPNDTTPGSVTQADYDVWKSNFGNHSGSGSGAGASVPEPASLLLLLSGTLAICLRRCQKGRKLINV